MKASKTLIGKAPALKALLNTVKIIAPTDVNVLITGETVTGKELIAAAIQKSSLRNDKAFITLNCAALPESLIESELFGYCKGAFTGADTDKRGLFAAADGGTLLLDEINSLPISIQTKLLRFIECGEYVPVGSVKTQIADVRIIAASNADLRTLVNAGDFRNDLYFRLSVVPLQVPPLRERTQDIKLLLNHFMRYFASKYAVRTAVISPEVMALLERYSWPGNIRELRNLCECLSVLRMRKTIEIKDLPPGHLDIARKAEVAYPFRLPDSGVVWGELEAGLIRQALAKTKRKYKASSELLGISRDTLYYRMTKYGL